MGLLCLVLVFSEHLLSAVDLSVWKKILFPCTDLSAAKVSLCQSTERHFFFVVMTFGMKVVQS